ncbi:uncharacterized protein LMH87_009047 [Akanthomyces muscarius]|uniref:Uncharacterized protein n=1 Tax=Akanthomyces muscarius TaxID=2231603 RepID=A0A9W8QJW1_AKAMU|nr:uncharacterized protein LMH87_009047 [Akanthomyces muscarius]KAJ4158524.1 hypothetical protein LMH87_009047 [Akanthomyces muscarius]
MTRRQLMMRSLPVPASTIADEAETTSNSYYDIVFVCDPPVNLYTLEDIFFMGYGWLLWHARLWQADTFCSDKAQVAWETGARDRGDAAGAPLASTRWPTICTSKMATVKSSASPFSIRLLEQHAVASGDERDQLLTLLPASYRRQSGDLAAAGQYVTACVEEELDLRRLTSIQGWLWMAGIPLPPRALHHQLLLGREIIITERMDMHLVWTTGRMFLKPIPRFLLEPAFWIRYLANEQCGCSPDTNVVNHAIILTECRHPHLRASALGFLYSYAALLSHESDFLLAQEKHLLPPEIAWCGWRILVEQLDIEHILPRIDRRFVHGELRLSRLNKIYILARTPMRGYMARWDQSGWQRSPSATIGRSNLRLIVLRFCGTFLRNWMKAIHQKRRRYSELGISQL